jgi:Protein of unknown function (DUF3995)
MNDLLKELAGIIVAAFFIADGLLHVYWATGRIWPAPDRLSLVRIVLNSNKAQLFEPATLIPLACLLFTAALIVLARVHHLGAFGRQLPEWFLQAGILAVAAGFLLRALAGIAWALGLIGAKSKLFYKLNLLFYTPICLALFAAAALAADFK